MRKRAIFSGCLALALLSGVGCNDAMKTSTQVGSGDSTQESATPTGGKGDIYGEDNRLDYFESSSDVLRRAGRSTAILMDEEKLQSVEGEEAYSVDAPTLSERLDVCRSVRFDQQPAPGDCSGFLVGDDILVSAGHCIETEADCESTRFVFDYFYEESAEEDLSKVASEDVYRCESIVKQDFQWQEDIDYGVYKLDRPVEDREPLAFRKSGKIDESTGLAVVGYPMGLPLKLTAGGTIVDNEPEKYIEYNLDAFGGHSGAAVVNVHDGKVEAIHVRGAPDYEWTREEGERCRLMRRCEEVDNDNRYCGGTEGTRATMFASHVPESEQTGTCCKVCDAGKACGDTCIPTDATCHTASGCACDG